MRGNAVALVIFAVVAVALHITALWLLGLWGGLVLACRYSYSLWRHPWWPCRFCGGSRKHGEDGKLWAKASGRCWYCHGDGEHPRLGVRIFTPARYQEMKARRHGRNY